MRTVFILLLSLILCKHIHAQPDFTDIPSKKQFLKMTTKYKTDTFLIGNYMILRVKRNKSYCCFGYQKNISQMINEIIYLVNDSLTFKTYTFNIKPERINSNVKNDFFLFPDSTLGILTYHFTSPFHEGSCGSCVYKNIYITQIKRNFKTSNVLHLYQHYDNNLSIVKEKGQETTISGSDKNQNLENKFTAGWDTIETINEVNIYITSNLVTLKMKYNDCTFNTEAAKCNYYLKYQTNAVFNLTSLKNGYNAKFSHLKSVK